MNPILDVLNNYLTRLMPMNKLLGGIIRGTRTIRGIGKKKPTFNIRDYLGIKGTLSQKDINRLPSIIARRELGIRGTLTDKDIQRAKAWLKASRK